MKGGAAIWMLGLLVSALVHIGAAAGLMAALQPDPVAEQPVPQSQLNVAAQDVTRSRAEPKTADASKADASETSGTSLGAGTISQSTATSVDPLGQTDQIAPSQAAGQAAQAVVPPAPAADPARFTAETTTASALPTTSAEADTVELAKLATTTITPEKTPPQSPPSAAVADAALPVSTVAAPSPRPDPVDLAAPRPVAVAPAALQANAARSRTPDPVASQPQTPEVTTSKAVLAFPASGSIDPVSLAAFQSFTQPESAASTDVRDSVTAALSVPCSRMQVTFDPDTATLRLNGHVPRPDQRAPLVAALQAEMGSDIEVQENLLILPEPQCAALSGIADVGLPQSTDQITNPLIVGADTHARAFRYVAGDPLVLDLTAPDYPAYVYVDYFDAGGNVIHLVPNEQAPLRRAPAKSALQIGARSAGEAGLFVKIGPPYGQEIAAAFAASVPLYDGFRPLVEPADAYLSWLKDRIAQARADNPDFKGEWVYFFVTTAAD